MRRATLAIALLLATAAHAPWVAKSHAQNYPEKNIRFIVPFAPGGTTDYLARMLGQKFTETWNQPVIVDNRGGAGGTIGANAAAKSPPDGYTIVLTAISHATAVGFYQSLPYNLSSDLDAVSLIATQPNALAMHPSLPAKSLKHFIALAKARPGEIAFSSTGNGSAQHLMGELFKTMAKIETIHVPYKGTAPALRDLISGHVSYSFQPLINAIPNAKAGRIRVLAVTSPKRSSAAPEIPTMDEAGVPGYSVVAWYGVHAPARTPRNAVDLLNKEINRVLGLQEIRGRLLKLGLEPAANTPEQFSAFVTSEVGRWTKVIENAGIKPN